MAKLYTLRPRTHWTNPMQHAFRVAFEMAKKAADSGDRRHAYVVATKSGWQATLNLNLRGKMLVVIGLEAGHPVIVDFRVS